MKAVARAMRCPICGKPAATKVEPFCSPRCADVDLNRWFVGAYVVPGSEEDDPPETPAEAGAASRDGDR